LPFSNWKVFAGDIEKGGAPELDDSKWETLPLARFWSAADTKPGVTWFRRKVFVEKNLRDLPMFIDRPRDAEIEVYVNGFLARSEKRGASYKPLLLKEYFKLGAENLIAVRYKQTGGQDEPAWATALRGAEAVENTSLVKLAPSALTLKPGQNATFAVELKNPFDMQIEGEALLASPLYSWPEGGAYSMISLTPASRTFKAAPRGRASVSFDITIPPGAQPGTHVAAVKLIFKGMAIYSEPLRITVK
jgi:hypothetical protein